MWVLGVDQPSAGICIATKALPRSFFPPPFQTVDTRSAVGCRVGQGVPQSLFPLQPLVPPNDLLAAWVHNHHSQRISSITVAEPPPYLGRWRGLALFRTWIAI